MEKCSKNKHKQNLRGSELFKNQKREEEKITLSKIKTNRLRKEIDNSTTKDEYYKPNRNNNFWTNNYIECKSNNDKNMIVPVKEYLNEITSYKIKFL